MERDDYNWNKRKPMMKVPDERFFHAGAVCGDKHLFMFGGQLGESKDYTNEAIVLNTSRIY
jgi:hypothetical protein